MQHTQTLPPGPKGLPYVGNALQFQRDPLTFLRRNQRQYERMVGLRLGNDTVVAFFRPEHVRYFLMEHPRNFKKPNLGNGANLKMARAARVSQEARGRLRGYYGAVYARDARHVAGRCAA